MSHITIQALDSIVPQHYRVVNNKDVVARMPRSKITSG